MVGTLTTEFDIIDLNDVRRIHFDSSDIRATHCIIVFKDNSTMSIKMAPKEFESLKKKIISAQ